MQYALLRTLVARANSFIPKCQQCINRAAKLFLSGSSANANSNYHLDWEENKFKGVHTSLRASDQHLLDQKRFYEQLKAFDEMTQEALVVQDRKKVAMWKFPGGFSEPGEDLGLTAVREVQEETGIRSEYQSLLTFRQQHNVRFGQSDLYFICRLKPLSREISMCPEEISKCQWMTLSEIIDNSEATPMTKHVAKLIQCGHTHGYDTIDIESIKMQSWLDPLQTFKVFSRPFVEQASKNDEL